MRSSSARDIYDRAPTRTDVKPAPRPSMLDDRYKPADAPVRSAVKSTATPRPVAADRTLVKPAARPSDVVGSSVVGSNVRPLNPVRGSTAGSGSVVGGSTAPIRSNTVVATAGAPRLNPPSVVDRMTRRVNRSPNYGGSVRVWDPYCDLHPYAHVWGWSSPFHMHCGSGNYYWHFNLFHPWFCNTAHTWYGCHYDWWWHRSSCYGTYSSSYWWYPSSSYCPTYLYVPSSVVYYETRVVEEAAPAPAVVAAPAAAAKELAPRSLADKYLELGDFYFRGGRYDEAADAYARARTYAPADAGVHLVLADASFATGDYHFAAFLIKEALRLDPALAAVKFDKRTLYGDAKQFEAQMLELDRYLAEHPFDAMAHLVQGYNLLFSDRALSSVASFRRVLEISPGDAAAERFLVALETPEAGEAGIR